jgi:hypothetical protein
MSPLAGEASPVNALEERTGVLPFDPITRIELLQHVKTLAGDPMAGRRTGELGAERAADYIEAEFRRAGLRPGGDSGSYRQQFEARTGARMGDRNRLTLHTGGRRWELSSDRDWRPLGFSASTHGRIEARVVFCGYGITAEHPTYDDFAGQDVRGRVVLLLPLEPAASDSTSPFAGTVLTAHADLRRKVANAHEHGAAAVLVLTDDAATPGDARSGFDSEASVGSVALPAAQVRTAALQSALTTLDLDLDLIAERIDSSLHPASFPLDLTAELEVDVEPITAEATNVVGILPGSDPSLRGEAIVVGAHYDHLGRGMVKSPDGEPVEEIMNGADDNASGVAALIEVAAAIRTDPILPSRTLVFVAFTGEELGLLGSQHYVESPAVPLARTRAMINMDTIGRGPEGRVFVAGAATSPVLKAALVEESAADFLTVAYDDEVLGASDQAPFRSRGIPVLFFFTPAHADYHRPTDDWEKIDFHYLERIARLVDRVACRLAASGEPIPFQEAAHPAEGHDRGDLAASYGTRGYGPYLGTVPDFGSPGEGVRLAAVREGSPAAAAGLKDGDVIIGWDGREIRTLGDYAQALRSQRPGDSIQLTLLRQGAAVRAVAVLGERP